jgi:pimeloyl-ACP methyl ester carboxylesterase
MPQKEITFNSEGLKLSGVFHKSSGNIGNAILVHGIINDKDEDGTFIKLAKKLSAKGYNVLRFDFRGHGESEGVSENVTIAGELEDLRNAIEQLNEIAGEKSNFIIIAMSFGAVSSILYSSKNQGKVKKLVLWNPVLDFDKTILNALTPWGKTFFNNQGYEELRNQGYITVPTTDFHFGKRLIEEFSEVKPYQLLSNFKIPVLTVHGTENTVIAETVEWVTKDDSKQ